MRLSILLTVIIGFFGFATAGHAQGWWDQAQEVLNSESGKQVLKTIEQQTGVQTNQINGGQNVAIAALSQADIIVALKDALVIGADNVVVQLGQTNGFALDPHISIPLPANLERVDSALSRIGMNILTQDLELRLNRAAEAATPKAKALLMDSIRNMSIDDAKSILSGPDDAATQYLRRAMGPSLLSDIEPIIDSTLAQAGAMQAYERTMGQYQALPFMSAMPDMKGDLKNYVAEQALDGIFYYVAAQERQIRNDPARWSSDMLKKVMSAQK